MESLRSVIASMDQDEFLSSVDITDAYLHVPIARSHQRFLRFVVASHHYQFVALPFGLATAPRVFTKILAPIIALLRARGILLIPYLDDILIKGPSYDQNRDSLHITLDTLDRFGWIINHKKSCLTPSRCLSFLGMDFDTVRARVILPIEKQRTLQLKIRTLISHQNPSIRFAMKVLGGMVSAIEAIPFAQFHTRPLQRVILKSWDRTQGSLDRPLLFSPSLRKALEWWLVSPSVSRGKSFPPVSWTILTTDASLHGWGGSASPPYGSGNMVREGSTASYQHPGASGDIPLTVTLDPAAAGSSGPCTDGQRYGCSIPESSGGHAQRGSNDGILQDSAVGRSPRSVAIGGSHSRRGKLDGRFSQQRKSGSGRMVSSSTSIRSTVPPMGPSGRGLDGIKVQSQGPGLSVTDARPTVVRGGRSGSSLARLPSVICVSSTPSAVQTPAEDKERGNPGNSNCPRLAPTSLVRKSSLPTRRRPVASATSQRPALTGSNLPSAFRAATFNGVAVESAILKNCGFSEEVTSTMLKARKPVSAQIYHRVWRSFFSWCEEHSFPPLQFSLPRILSFLQRGLELGLALSSLRGQISALSILFQKPLASRGPVKTFLQGVAHIAPPYRSPVVPWDLNLVLSVLQGSPFEPIRDVSLRFLSWKVAFLVAVTSLRRVSELAALSCKPPFLVFHQDKVVLRPPPEFLPKVVSAFHINEDIVLPSFCPSPSHQKEKALHCLDVVRALRVYLSVSASFRRSDSLFIIPDGPRKGLAASKATIAKWIRLAIAEAYRVRGKTPPTRIVAHSTRAVGASWAMHHQASASQLCKAATWSSMHTFTKFYRVHTFASADASVGRKVLQAAVV